MLGCLVAGMIGGLISVGRDRLMGAVSSSL